MFSTKPSFSHDNGLTRSQCIHQLATAINYGAELASRALRIKNKISAFRSVAGLFQIVSNGCANDRGSLLLKQTFGSGADIFQRVDVRQPFISSSAPQLASYANPNMSELNISATSKEPCKQNKGQREQREDGYKRSTFIARIATRHDENSLLKTNTETSYPRSGAKGIAGITHGGKGLAGPAAMSRQAWSGHAMEVASCH